MAQLIKNNSDFLFIYEAIQCNPNGDPDQENKPRMDYDTNTNLVTDVRLKRYMRDYLKSINKNIFVDLEGESKVSPETKLTNYINSLDENEIEFLLNEFPTDKDELLKIRNDLKGKSLVAALQANKNKDLNYLLLSQLVKREFTDVRMFGSAFAIKEFTKAFTGPIQLTWGYSLNKVKLIDTASIVTIMNDDNSTFGKDYRLYYSLIAFHGTINKNAAVSTGLSEDDKVLFRDAIWNSVQASPTRSKINQYPKLYVEFEYNENYGNGQFGDLRNYISVSTNNIDFDNVRKFSDLNIDLSKLIELKNTNNSIIKNCIVKSSNDFITNF